jgi:DNA-directed RNA polymerase I, II, and III subunit RPABC1
MEIDTIRAHLKEMLESRGDDVSYIEEHGDVVETSRYYSELIELGTDNTTVFFVLSKELLKKWRQQEESPEKMVDTYKTKNFILILSDSPSPAAMHSLTAWDKELQAQGGMLQVFFTKELMYNPMKHELVPKHEKLSEADTKAMMEQYLVKSKAQLPIISRNDPIARRLGLRHGDVVKITRYNDTSGVYYYYRCCV